MRISASRTDWIVTYVQANYAALQNANYTTLEKAKIGADKELLRTIDAIEAKLFPYKFTNQGMSLNADVSMFFRSTIVDINHSSTCSHFSVDLGRLTSGLSCG